MATARDLLQALDDIVTAGVRRGLLHNVAQDERLDGRSVTVDGRRLVNFGSCSYLGLETHPALKAGVIDATERFGTQFSSSRAYLSAPPYAAAEEALTSLFGRPTLITPSTTMGHLAALPTLIGPDDALILDHQVHHSVQTAAKLAQVQGSTAGSGTPPTACTACTPTSPRSRHSTRWPSGTASCGSTSTTRTRSRGPAGTGAGTPWTG
jgi:7-keto-8-aminopelargonate synthetase-like enzyme